MYGARQGRDCGFIKPTLPCHETSSVLQKHRATGWRGTCAQPETPHDLNGEISYFLHTLQPQGENLTFNFRAISQNLLTVEEKRGCCVSLLLNVRRRRLLSFDISSISFSARFKVLLQFSAQDQMVPSFPFLCHNVGVINDSSICAVLENRSTSLEFRC